jgi:hypothetical protein
MTQKKSGGRTIVWWVGWITLTILSFFAASAVWTPWIARRFGTIHDKQTAALWVAAVFGTWMVMLIPLIIVMYQKVDKAYEDARIRREKNANRFRSIFIEKSKREIPAEVAKKIDTVPETIAGGHLVTAVLKDGRAIPNVFIANKEILGIYNASEMDFEGKDVVAVELTDMSRPPVFQMPQWLRLDGVLPPE